MIEHAELRRFRIGLAVVLSLIVIVWAGYQLAQERYDPRHDAPGFDSAYYLAWSDAILTGADPGGRFDGAFYRAPLYAYGISLLRGGFGAGIEMLRWLQLALALAATVLLARAAFDWAGAAAGIGTAALLGAYHPWLFFSSRLLAESLALFLLALALALIARRSPFCTVTSGLAVGLAVLARPNLLLVGLAWLVVCWFRGRRRKAVALLLVLGAVVLPVTAWNWQRSGHVVPVSANGGLTLYHGNGPGAVGVFTAAAGMGAAIASQRAEATRSAAALSGAALDPVEADRYWGRRALGERLSHPVDTVLLLWNRLLLTVGSAEIMLDEAPTLDPNPWSRAAFVPFALIFALAAAGTGASHRAGAAVWVWTAVAACAATPLLFYVSSRYRLPLSILLAVPAGAGVARLLAGNRRAAVTALAAGLVSVAVPLIAPLTLPYSRVLSEARADGLAELATAFHARAQREDGETERKRWSESARAALARGHRADETSAKLWFVEGLIARDEGREADAEAAWQRAWRDGRVASPRVAAAANLSEIWIRGGRAPAAIRLLRDALRLEPRDETCRHNLIAALVAVGDHDGARDEIDRARSMGVPVDPALTALARDGR